MNEKELVAPRDSQKERDEFLKKTIDNEELRTSIKLVFDYDILDRNCLNMIGARLKAANRLDLMKSIEEKIREMYPDAKYTDLSEEYKQS